MTAKMIAHSVGADAPPLATMELRYWRGIHSEFMTHRVFSRNARSSRAVPVPRLIEEVATNPFVPKHWGANQKGMQAGAECSAKVLMPGLDGGFFNHREDAWLHARDKAVEMAQAFHDAGYHKQIVNRLLEPFMFIDVLVTSTEWSNFFALRDDPMAEPHIRDLAVEMKEVMQASAPRYLKPGDWHLPYAEDEGTEQDVQSYLQGCGLPLRDREIQDVCREVSVTRCARISYTPFHGESGDIAAEVARHDQLVSARPMHASPCEHQATPDLHDEHDGWRNPHLHGNLRGWKQYRKTLNGENQ